MIPRWAKSSYYAVASPIMRINSARHRTFPASKVARIKRVHLGPGQKNYLVDWVNVDANFVSSKPDIWSDIRFKLPFVDESLDCIYSHHVIEHLPDLKFHFEEMYRCVKPGGIIRVGGPHGGNAMKALNDGLYDWFGDWPVKRTSMGGRFENFIFCQGEHLTILTGSFLDELAADAGFKNIEVLPPGETGHPELITDEVLLSEPNTYPKLPKTLMIEAIKPAIN